MRLKKLVFKLIVLVMIFVIITLSICIFYKKDNKENNYTILLGNPLDTSITIEYDDTFTSEFMSSSYLIKMFTNDASKSVDGKLIKLSNLIKKADIVILNIGKFEIYSLINMDTNNYDEEILNRSIDVYLNHLDSIINNIKQIKENIGIYVCNIKYPTQVFDKNLASIFNILNESINEKVNKNDVKILA